ncbi:D-Ala-D-Ala carboxypeptidase family metallohydrolase [Roseisolibacter sp. H3M3-2]|uniref:D-Ala-D-Ala carboxypeptidase family metallohydrolase n=1 Tax=Roseisolibacter sp. H3M3-2 TaxID=3031323 RepID=UPI0023DA6348|nr:D-Ala-D-Ala carboxypeptidase family metallohydrolase [Roseisolibacter sp. H3M3-2]MDF1504184.1 DUF882 domain-containing protein [Roseisolibacter sp. H3M3-2]
MRQEASARIEDRIEDAAHHAAEELAELAALVERALQLPEPAASWWHRPSVGPRGERWLEAASSLVLLVLASAWAWSLVVERGRDLAAGGEVDRAVTPTTRAVTAALTRTDAPSTAFLTDAALRALGEYRGQSGKLRLVQQAPGDSLHAELPAGTAVDVAPADARTGLGRLAVRVGTALQPVSDLRVVRLTPLSERRGGRIGRYFVGTWPTERGRARGGLAADANYAPPRGLIQVTRENQDTPLSEHFRLRHFLTHDQRDVWPKYVVVQPRLLDKLELVLADLESRGIPARGVYVMSGFRTPQYNAGGGNTAGRASLSRHMYGDAADVWIDNDGDGRMDDLNRDGRVDMRDSQVMAAAVDRVERAHPDLVGGVGIYPTGPGHGPFTHIDARGYRARWTGGPGGG